jgi:hypothetical protein
MAGMYFGSVRIRVESSSPLPEQRTIFEGSQFHNSFVEIVTGGADFESCSWSVGMGTLGGSFIAIRPSGSLVHENVTIVDNVFEGDGYCSHCLGVMVEEGSQVSLNILRSQFLMLHNTWGTGGLMFAARNGNLNVTDSIFSQNQGYLGQGGAVSISHQHGAVRFQNCTFTRNNAGEGVGGAIFVAGYTNHIPLTLINCSFIQNRARAGQNMYMLESHVLLQDVLLTSSGPSSSFEVSLSTLRAENVMVVEHVQSSQFLFHIDSAELHLTNFSQTEPGIPSLVKTSGNANLTIDDTYISEQAVDCQHDEYGFSFLDPLVMVNDQATVRILNSRFSGVCRPVMDGYNGTLSISNVEMECTRSVLAEASLLQATLSNIRFFCDSWTAPEDEMLVQAVIGDSVHLSNLTFDTVVSMKFSSPNTGTEKFFASDFLINHFMRIEIDSFVSSEFDRFSASSRFWLQSLGLVGGHRSTVNITNFFLAKEMQGQASIVAGAYGISVHNIFNGWWRMYLEAQSIAVDHVTPNRQSNIFLSSVAGELYFDLSHSTFQDGWVLFF